MQAAPTLLDQCETCIHAAFNIGDHQERHHYPIVIQLHVDNLAQVKLSGDEKAELLFVHSWIQPREVQEQSQKHASQKWKSTTLSLFVALVLHR